MQETKWLLITWLFHIFSAHAMYFQNVGLCSIYFIFIECNAYNKWKYSHLSVFVQNSSSVALLHKHLQLLLPHATDIFSRSATLIKESSWNGSIREKLQGEDKQLITPAGADDVSPELSLRCSFHLCLVVTFVFSLWNAFIISFPCWSFMESLFYTVPHATE